MFTKSPAWPGCGTRNSGAAHAPCPGLAAAGAPAGSVRILPGASNPCLHRLTAHALVHMIRPLQVLLSLAWSARRTLSPRWHPTQVSLADRRMHRIPGLPWLQIAPRPCLGLRCGKGGSRAPPHGSRTAARARRGCAPGGAASWPCKPAGPPPGCADPPAQRSKSQDRGAKLRQRWPYGWDEEGSRGSKVM